MRTENLWRAADDVDAGLTKTFLDIRQGEDAIDLGVELRDHVLRRGGRGDHAEPNRHLVAGHTGLVDSGYVAHRRRAPGGGDRQGAQAASLDVLDHIGNVVEHGLYLATDQVGHGWRAALVGNMGEIDPCHHLEQFHRQVVGRAVAGRGVGDDSRLCLRCGQEVLDRFVGRVRIDYQQIGCRTGPGKRREVACNVQFRLHMQAVDQRERKCNNQDGMPVGRRLGHEIGTDHGAAARLVFHDRTWRETLGKFLCQGASERVVESAGREGHYHLDGLGGKGLRDRRRTRQQCNQQNGGQPARCVEHIALLWWMVTHSSGPRSPDA